MENYQKSISYLDYLEDGIKIRNAGFARTEERNGRTRLEIQVKNLPEKYSGQYELHTDCGKAVGRISLNRGYGSCCMVWDWAELKHSESVEAKGVCLMLPEGKLVQAAWSVPLKMAVEPAETKIETKTETAPEVLETAKELQEETAEAVWEQEREQYYGDKWEQLCHKYPCIHPFGDRREFLSVTPAEFVVLCKEYHKMVHNSFLLHGFYNYHHLLLGRIRKDEEWQYYLGVPGNFYTREKMVAEMFGFEAFESEKEPASPGDFGYYMKRVDI